MTGGPLTYLSPGDWITLQARHAPHRRCMIEGDGTVHTFGAVNSRVNRLVRALQGAGVRRHDRIGILATDSVDYMIVVMASLKLGSTLVPYNYRFAVDELVALVRTAPLDAFVTCSRYADMIDPIREASPGLKVIATIDHIDGLPTVDDLVSSTVDDDSNVVVPVEPEDIVSLMFTSGTTGFPKGVMQSARMLTGAATAAMIDLRFQPDDFRYSGAAMFHLAGLGYVMYAVARGCAALILPKFDPEVLVDWMSDGGLTGVVLMPTMVRDVLSVPGMKERTYPTMRDLIYGGSPMDATLLREALDVFGCRFYNSFGAGTEAVGQTLFTPEDHLRALEGEEHLLGSIGKPSWGVELRLCDADGNDVPDGEVGAIWVRSNTVMSGYLDDPARTAEAVRDGWFTAGDLAWRDPDGYLFLAGRQSDMIIRGGENVYPVEIESVLLEHPDVASAAVVGLPEPRWGEIVVAAVELRAGATLDEAALRQHCRNRLAAYKVPERIWHVGELPRNINGKVQKFRLAELLTEQAPEAR